MAALPLPPHLPSSNNLSPSRGQNFGFLKRTGYPFSYREIGQEWKGWGRKEMFLVIRIILLVSTPDFSEASSCLPRKKGQADEAQEECCCPLPGRGLHNQKGSLDNYSPSAQANILSLDLPPGHTPSLGFEIDGSEHCLVTFQKVQKIPLNPRPQRGCLAEEILVPDCWTEPLKATFCPPHKRLR